MDAIKIGDFEGLVKYLAFKHYILAHVSDGIGYIYSKDFGGANNSVPELEYLCTKKYLFDGRIEYSINIED